MPKVMQFLLGFAAVINVAYVFLPSMVLHFLGAFVLFGMVLYQARELIIRERLIKYFASDHVTVVCEPTRQANQLG